MDTSGLACALTKEDVFYHTIGGYLPLPAATVFGRGFGALLNYGGWLDWLRLCLCCWELLLGLYASLAASPLCDLPLL
jgi:hypothetical protein